jgi:hypothetical protein
VIASRIAAFLAVPLMAACAGGQGPAGTDAFRYDTVSTFPLPQRVAALRRDRTTGAFEIGVSGSDAHIPLHGYTSARVIQVLDAGGDRVAVVAGQTYDCPLRYTLVALGARSFAYGAIGRCGESLAFSGDGRGIVASGQGAADPEVWLYRDRAIKGPVLASSLVQPQHRQPWGWPGPCGPPGASPRRAAHPLPWSRPTRVRSSRRWTGQAATSSRKRCMDSQESPKARRRKSGSRSSGGARPFGV